MRFTVMTLFPELIETIASSSIIGRAVDNGIISVKAVNIRDYSKEKHHHVDDYPYGGGKGMLMQAGPVYDCFQDILKTSEKTPRVIYLDPAGRTFDQNFAKELASEEEIVFLCGHYEGIDERVLEMIVTDRVSIGDYVVTGGELPSMIIADAVSRMIPGVLSEGSADEESFSDGLLEYPQYTRPEEFMGRKVPEVLLSGHHENVSRWRRERAIERTYRERPELLSQAVLSKKEKSFLESLKRADETK